MRCIAIVGLVAGCDSATSNPVKPPTSMGSSGEPGVAVSLEERPRPSGGVSATGASSPVDAGIHPNRSGTSGGQ